MELQSTLTALEVRILQYAEGVAGPFQPGHAGAIFHDESILSIKETAENLVRKNLLKRFGYVDRGRVDYEIVPAGIEYLSSIGQAVECAVHKSYARAPPGY
jgi:hypothetical protein